MKKGLIISIFLLLLVGMFSVANAEQIKHFSFKIPSTPEEMKVKERLDHNMVMFKSAVNQDILSGYHLNLEGFKEVTIEELTGNTQNKTLSRLFSKILQQQEIGDILPTIYVKGDNGYILEKKADGQNVIYLIENHNGWTIVKTINKNGKIIQYEDVNPQ